MEGGQRCEFGAENRARASFLNENEARNRRPAMAASEAVRGKQQASHMPRELLMRPGKKARGVKRPQFAEAGAAEAAGRERQRRRRRAQSKMFSRLLIESLARRGARTHTHTY